MSGIYIEIASEFLIHEFKIFLNYKFQYVVEGQIGTLQSSLSDIREELNECIKFNYGIMQAVKTFCDVFSINSLKRTTKEDIMQSNLRMSIC